MIEQAIREALLASGVVVSLVEDRVFPGIAPEKIAGAYVVYAQTGAQESGGFDVTENTDTFTFNFVPVKGTGSGRYLDAKALAMHAHQALRFGFSSTGICVYHAERIALADKFHHEQQQHWVEATYRFSHDTKEY